MPQIDAVCAWCRHCWSFTATEADLENLNLENPSGLEGQGLKHASLPHHFLEDAKKEEQERCIAAFLALAPRWWDERPMTEGDIRTALGPKP